MLLSTGITTLDLGLTGKIAGGIQVGGKYVSIPGDSNTGKTWLATTILAVAANDPKFDEYDLVYIDAEKGYSIDIKQFFGKKLAKRIQFHKPEFLEDIYYIYDDLDKKNKKFISVVDSLDAVTTRQDDAKFQEKKKADQANKKAAGTYGMSVAKYNSGHLRHINNILKRRESVAVILSQTRQAVNSMSFVPEKTTSGGLALKFYAQSQVWVSHYKSIKEKIRDKNRKVGAQISFDIKKNHNNGQEVKVIVDYRKGYGYDDVGTNIDFLIDEKHWKKASGGISAKEFGVVKSREKLIQYIHSNALELQLKKLVKKVWHEVQDELRPKRPQRFA